MDVYCSTLWYHHHHYSTHYQGALTVAFPPKLTTVLKFGIRPTRIVNFLYDLSSASVSGHPFALAASSHSAWLPTHAHPLLSVHNPDVRASKTVAGLAVGRKAVAQRASAAAMRWTCWTRGWTERRAERRIVKKKKMRKSFDKTTARAQHSE